jgi:hypothetical protein
MGEKKVNGRTLGLWRPWELCQALDDSLRPLINEGAAASNLTQVMETVRIAIDAQHTGEARQILERQVRPALDPLAEPQRQRLIRLYNDLMAVLQG